MQLNSLKSLFSPSEKYHGVIPIKVYVMKLFFLLMFLLVAKDAWSKLISHKGDWNPEIAVAWCSIAAYTTLSGLGVIHTLRMMPIMLFMFFYKSLWLLFVAYPLWSKGALAGSDAEGWAMTFILVILPILFAPWGYIFRTFVLGKQVPAQHPYFPPK